MDALKNILFPAVTLAALLGGCEAQAYTEMSPQTTVKEAFQRLTGRELDRREQHHLAAVIRDLEEMAERPQQASYLSDLWDNSLVLPIICLVGRAGFRLPSLGKMELSGTNWNFEKTPCLVLNNINPYYWDSSQFTSYVMTGTSFAQANGTYGGVTGGVMLGIYYGPKTLKPMVGTYGFARVTVDKGLAKILAQVAYAGTKQLIVMGGVGASVSVEALLTLIKILPKVTTGAVSVGGVKGELGAYFDVKEVPWFARLMAGQDPLTAFAN